MRTIRGLVTRRRRDDGGVASLELLAMMPLVFLFALLALQVGAFLWAITSTNEAVRQGARAQSLGDNGCQAAEDTLTDTLVVEECRNRGGSGLGGVSVQLVVRVPVLPFVEDYVPDVRVTRDAYLP